MRTQQSEICAGTLQARGMGTELGGQKDLLHRFDYMLLRWPLIAETHHLIEVAELVLMKPPASDVSFLQEDNALIMPHRSS